ncbi:2834_t:CDS:2 [Cetraspora pellucida]|uniref:2834_t:CDS:1 n=1 Tax=Cetraspora pellucida TaxID=1433469 RepID=A0A9N9HMN9_9GLOM|nr:2834_t:CDS:2 [Cetraspora pellucida]
MASLKGTDKVLEKLKESVENGNYYEAHQMYRTVCRRTYLSLRLVLLLCSETSNKHLLYSGAQTLLKHKQTGSGVDLSLYLIDAYNDEEMAVNDESRARIIQLLLLFPSDEPGRKRFIDSAVRASNHLHFSHISWSVKFGENPAGDPELHHFVAELLYKDKMYSEAEPHFLAGTAESSKVYGRMLAEWSSQDHPSKIGAYIARAVLQYLCLRSIRDAKFAFESFIADLTEKVPELKAGTAQYNPTITGDAVDVTIYLLPLLNFLQLLILTVQREASDLFGELRNRYKSVLSVEPSFEDLLNKIGEVFFNIRVQRPQQFNIFQDLVNSLFTSGPGTPSAGGTPYARVNPQGELD